MVKTIKSTSGTVKYRLKDVKSKNETSIILDYSYGRNNRIKFATGFKVLPKNWDQKNQRIRAVSTIKNREKVNNDLSLYTSNFLDAVSKLNEKEKAKREKLKILLNRIIRKKEINQKTITNFFEFVDNYIESKEKQLKSTGSIKLSPITIRSYKQTVKRVKDFDKQLNYNLDFDTIDLIFYYAFIEYLEQKKYSINTIGKHIKNLVTLLNRATEEGVNTCLKYKHSEFKTVSEKTYSIYLTNKEIDDLYKVDLSKNKNWELARDIFLIGYYTGQRISDYNGIKKEQIKSFNGQEVFEFNQQKTNKRIYVPVHHRVKQIMNRRYDGNLPPKLNNADLNLFIKEAAKKAKINEEITYQKIIGGKKVHVKKLKYELLVSHSSRRSFCSNAYLSKMPVIDIMAISGHSTEREFFKYIKVTPQEKAIKIAGNDFYKN